MSYIKTAIVLAGGMGTRLRSVIGKQQKCLTNVGGKPFIYKILDSLKVKDISKVILATGFMAESVENQLGNNYAGMDLIYSIESSPLGTGGALIKASKLVTEEHYLVLNGDSFVNFSLKDLIAYHLERNSKFTILLTKTDDSKHFGSVELDAYGNILSFIEKDISQANWVNAGVYLIDRNTFLNLEPAELSLERDIFPKLIGNYFFGFPEDNASFIDIGTPSSLNEANNFFTNKDKNASL